MKPDIKAQTLSDLELTLSSWNEPSYRARQVMEWLYLRRTDAWERMSNLPKGLHQRLADTFALNQLRLIRLQGARDTTQKFLWQLADGALIESVLIPANPALYGEPADRHTLCISTQVGCAYGCKFCASGLDGWKRNLTPDEIVEQVLSVERWHQRTIPANPPDSSSSAQVPENGKGGDLRSQRLVNNIVVMGMGEPLANYEHLLKALTILNAPWGGQIGARRITVSTSGLVPQILRLAESPFQFRLAISLHGASDEVRSRIMPVNRKYPLKMLMEACQAYLAKKGKMITFEYILIAGVNDRPDQTKFLADLARQVHAKVNLIPYNRVEGLSWDRPSEAVQETFLHELEQRGVAATLRREKGHDIDAACGQLRLRTEKELMLSSVPQSGSELTAPAEV